MAKPLREHQRIVDQVITELNIRAVRDKAVQTVGFLLESDPELLERIRRQASTSDEERRLWSYLFTYYSAPALGANHQGYLDWLFRMTETASFAIAIRDRITHLPTTTEELDYILNNPYVKDICDGRDDDIKLAKAAMLVAAIAEWVPNKSEAHKDSAAYVINHIDEVLSLLPELVRRKFLTKDEIALLIDGGHSSVSSGHL